MAFSMALILLPLPEINIAKFTNKMKRNIQINSFLNS